MARCYFRQLLQSAFAAREGRSLLPAGAQAKPELLVGVDAHGPRVHGAEAHIGGHPGLPSGDW